MAAKPIIFSLFNDEPFSDVICQKTGCELGKCTIHEFPDRETLVRIETNVKNRPVVLLASLDNPNSKIAPLIFAIETLRDAGASQVGLITPYLAYMRQDKAFHTGEAVTSQYFAKLLSSYLDWIITIAPHLHRWHDLNQVFSIPSTVLYASPNIANWIKRHAKQPVLIGPDMESRQWVAEIAKRCDAPYLIGGKKRTGDETVTSTISQLKLYPNHTPIVIDDIVSTGMTMLETIKHVQSYSTKDIICIGVHALFSKNAYQALLQTGISKLVTCNTILHPTNEIDLSNIIIEEIVSFYHLI
ncbi:MAG: ribose-phosphate diphosphokinase [Legionellales bacterium]|nr:ribose-phosphate diphosphokinase [Legionellales bacterium]